MYVDNYVTIDAFLNENYKKPDFYDILTGVISRKYILAYIQYLIEQKTPFSVSIIDVDNFKLVNDNYGHTIGDELLKSFSNNLINYLQNTAIVGRMGGDEFIIVNVGFKDYPEIKEFYLNFYMQKQIVRRMYSLEGNDFYITCTAGIACYPKDTENYNELLVMADKALYRGKAKGRNCYIIYVHEKHKDINIYNISSKKTYDIMNELTDAFVRGSNFEAAIKFSLNTAIELMGFTGAFYLDENLNLISTAYKQTVEITEFGWDELKSIVDKENMLQLHHIDYMEGICKPIYDYLMRFRVISLLLKKVRFATGNFGYIAFTDSSKSRIWQDEDITILTYIEKLIGISKTYKLN